jgi:hypothetical protein
LLAVREVGRAHFWLVLTVAGVGRPIMLNRIKAMRARLWRPRRRRSAEHGFHDQRAASQHRSQQEIEQARGEGYGPGSVG